MVDGISETFTMAVTEPYLDLHGCPCGDRGLAFMDREALADAVAAVDAAGLQAHFHAIGDRAVHDALDAVECARRVNGINDNRHQIAHLQLVRPEDRARFRRLAVFANVEGMWARRQTGSVQLALPHLDPERVGWHYPFADILAAGAAFAGGSDWPVNPPEPLEAMHVLVNRRAHAADGPPDEPLLPDQGISLVEAFRAYTSGSARVNHHSDVGTVQVGSRADLVVLDRDPFAGAVDEIAAAEVRLTYAGGVAVHAAS
jgi:predicted amidohydrolase YtcJ